MRLTDATVESKYCSSLLDNDARWKLWDFREFQEFQVKELIRETRCIRLKGFDLSLSLSFSVHSYALYILANENSSSR